MEPGKIGNVPEPGAARGLPRQLTRDSRVWLAIALVGVIVLVVGQGIPLWQSLSQSVWALGAAVAALLASLMLYRIQVRALSRRERELHISENRFRMIIEGTGVVAWEYDSASDALTYVSDSAVRLLGFPREAWRHSGFWRARLHADDRARVLAEIRAMKAPLQQHECTYRLIHAEGHAVPVRDLRTVVESHPGHVAGMRGVLIDITAIRQSEAAQEESEARFRGAFEQAAVGVALCSVGGRYLRVNSRYCEITGFPANELLLGDFRSITHPEDLEFHERLLDALVLRLPDARSIEKRIVRSDGREVWVRLSMSLVESRNRSAQFMEVIEDVTARRSAERELRDSEERLSTILRSMQEGVVMRDAAGEVVAANEAARRIYGLGTGERFLPQLNQPGFGFESEDGSLIPLSELPASVAMLHGRSTLGIVCLVRRDGSRCWLQSRAEPLERDAASGRYSVVVTLADITHSRHSEEAQRLAATVFHNSVEAMFVTDSRRCILSVNSAFTALTAFSPGDALGQTPMLLHAGGESLAHYDESWRLAKRNGTWQGEVRLCRQDGNAFPAALSISAVRNATGAVTHYVAEFSDITERKANEARIAFLAHHDPLTNLPNRTLFQDRLDQALARAERSHTQVGLLFLDLDRFKTINDSLGHLTGDRLLQAVGERLRHCVREGDTICRQGGDEFLIMLTELGEADIAARVATKILRRLVEPFEIDGQVLGTSFSIGISMYPQDGKSAIRLMKNADTAMYHAKESGRNTFRFFTEEMNTHATERLQIENLLRGALDRNEMHLMFQPQIDLASNCVVGAEALLRWDSPVLGKVAPGRFIPVAEETGLIVPLGRWILGQACREAARWHLAGHTGVTVGVNISVLQFRRDDIVAQVSLALAEAGLRADRLELELTESLLMDNAEHVLETIRRLKALGVRLSIDDFGTGYSSLSYLKRLDVDRLKIDQSFVRNVIDEPDDAAIVRAVIQLGRSLRLDVIAEGAETLDQIEFLRTEGCREAQGYHLYPPLSSAAMNALLARGVGNPQASETRLRIS